MDKYKVQPPDAPHFVLSLEPSSTIADAYDRVAERVGCAPGQLQLLVRNPPGAALPFVNLQASDALLRQEVRPGSVLTVEREAADGGAMDVDSTAAGVPVAQLWGMQPGENGSHSTGAPTSVAPPASVLPVPSADPVSTAVGGTTAPRGATVPAHRLSGSHAQMEAEGRAVDQRGLTGLANLGNTCYFNSAVQCLSNTRALTNELLMNGDHFADADGVVPAYLGLLRSLWSNSSHAGEAVAPHDLKSAVARRVPLFMGYDQQDATELMGVLLESLHEGLKRPAPAGAVKQDGSAESPPKDPSKVAIASWERAQTFDSSPVSDLFQGQLQSTVCCQECGRQEVSFELFWSLPLGLPAAGSEGSDLGSDPTLSDALDRFCREEPLEEGAWQCPFCKRGVRASKRLAFWRLPQVLQLHLKRFEWHERSSSSTSKPAPSGPGMVTGSSAENDTADEETMAEPPPLAAVAAERHAASSVEQETGDTPGVPHPPEGAAPPLPLPGDELEALAEPEPLTPENILDELAHRQTWEVQEGMYTLVYTLLSNIAKNPTAPKFRSVGKSSSRLQKGLLDLEGGTILLAWAGFEDTGDRFEAKTISAEEVAARQEMLMKHAEIVKTRHLRRLRDLRIEEEKRRSMPTGDGGPVQRWGGRLGHHGFGYGSAGMYGLRCSKVQTRLGQAVDESHERRFAPLRLDAWMGEGAPGPIALGGSEYELYAVIEHLGSTPFSGHYVASCWHEPSKSWYRFNDSHVSSLAASEVSSAAGGILNSGSYVVLLESVRTLSVLRC